MSGTPNQAFGETARDKSPSNAAGGLAPPSSCPRILESTAGLTSSRWSHARPCSTRCVPATSQIGSFASIVPFQDHVRLAGQDRTCQAPLRRWHEVIKPNIAHGVASRMDRRVKPGADKEMSSL